MLFKSAYIGLDEAAKMKCFQPLIKAFAERHEDKHMIVNGDVWQGDSKSWFEANGLNIYASCIQRSYHSDSDYDSIKVSIDWVREALINLGYSEEMLERVKEDYFNEASI